MTLMLTALFATAMVAYLFRTPEMEPIRIREEQPEPPKHQPYPW